MPAEPAESKAFLGANPPVNNVTDPVLRQAFRDFSKLMNKEYQVFRKERIPDEQGGFTEDFIQVLEVKGRLSIAARANETFDAGQWVNHVDYVLYVPAPKDIRRHDEIRGSGLTPLRVVEVKMPSQADFHLQIGLEETQKGR